MVGINPLHAHRNQPPDISPYCGISRIFRNPVYLDLEAVPSLDACESARAALAEQGPELTRLRATNRVDYAAIAACHRPVLEALYAWLARGALARDGGLGAEYRAFAERDGGLVGDFGVFMALSETHGPDWRVWPAALRDPRSPEVVAFAEEHAALVGLHVLAQFEMDRQLGDAARSVRGAGAELGLYQDLALGAAPSGFDSWAFQDQIVRGISLGAPPDAYSSEGQDWSIPPVDPRQIGAGGFRVWRLVLEATMRHSGVARIDHAMSLTRQFWVPHGRPASEGCYVNYPVRDLLGVLALTSRRHECVVVAEDLGTVPAGFASTLARAGVLSSRVLLFERGSDGGFRPASQYGKRALVTANTHDHPTLAGYASGRDLELRRELDLIDDEELAAALVERRQDLAQLRARLGLGDEASLSELIAAVHAFLGRTPVPLVGLSLDDLAGETEPVNLPGVAPERFASWTRRMATALDALDWGAITFER